MRAGAPGFELELLITLCILVLNYPLGESTGASFPPQALLTDVLIHVFRQIFSKQQQIWLKIGLFLKRLFNTGRRSWWLLTGTQGGHSLRAARPGG